MIVDHSTHYRLTDGLLLVQTPYKVDISYRYDPGYVPSELRLQYWENQNYDWQLFLVQNPRPRDDSTQRHDSKGSSAMSGSHVSVHQTLKVDLS